MSRINKTDSGLLFYDDFSERNLMWQLSPSDATECIKYGEKGLQILHGRRYVSFTIIEPDIEEYSCIVELEHIPFNFEDIGGILVLSNTKEYAECQTYLATGPSEMVNSPSLKEDVKELMQQINSEVIGDTFVTWSSDDNNWNGAASGTSVGSSESGSPTVSENYKDIVYRYIKFTKQKYKYRFWASEDTKTWIEIGNVKLDNSGVIGFFLYGTNNQDMIDNSHCYFKNFAIYNGRYITIDGITRNYDFEIFDEDGRTLLRTDDIAYYSIMSRSSKRTVVNTVNMPMPIKNPRLRIYSKENYEHTIDEFILGEEVYGGDGYILERNMQVFIDNNEILTSEVYNLGDFFRGNYFIKMDIVNTENYLVNDLKISVIKYSEYYGGEEQVEIALYQENTPTSELEYKKELIIPEIDISETRSIFIRLAETPEQALYLAANDYRFKIMIE